LNPRNEPRNTSGRLIPNHSTTSVKTVEKGAAPLDLAPEMMKFRVRKQTKVEPGKRKVVLIIHKGPEKGRKNAGQCSKNHRFSSIIDGVASKKKKKKKKKKKF
jgi:hypothetical protein